MAQVPANEIQKGAVDTGAVAIAAPDYNVLIEVGAGPSDPQTHAFTSLTG